MARRTLSSAATDGSVVIMAGRIANYRLFLKEFRRTFHTTGAILPSSPGLAAALARFVAEGNNDAVGKASESDESQNGQARRILEVGPGTGAVTSKILSNMASTDRIELVELNDEFVAHLRKRFAEEPAFMAVADRAEVIHDSLLALPAEPTYDVIVSGLPLNNFSSDLVRELLGSMRSLLKPGGTLSFFEYIAVRSVRGVVSRKPERQRLREISETLGGLFSEHEIRRDAVVANVPPAWVHHLRFN